MVLSKYCQAIATLLVATSTLTISSTVANAIASSGTQSLKSSQRLRGSASRSIFDKVILPALPLKEEEEEQQQQDEEKENQDSAIIVDEEASLSLCPVAVPYWGDLCRDAQIGIECDYGHIYTGCSWDELQCTWINRCTCLDDGTFVCTVPTLAPCGIGGIESNESVESLIVQEGLPWGHHCNPDDDLPMQLNNRPIGDIQKPDGTNLIRPPGVNDEGDSTTRPPVFDVDVDVDIDVDVDVDVDVEGRLEDECPPFPAFGSCTDSYITGLVCNYDHMFWGCSWDELSCKAVMRCECGQSGFEGEWNCMSDAAVSCDAKTTPVDLPRGIPCNPEDALPVASTTTTTTTAIARTTGTTTTDQQPLIVDMMSGAMP